MTRIRTASIAVSIICSASAVFGDTELDKTAAQTIVRKTEIQQKVLQFSDTGKRRALGKHVASDLRSEDIKQKRQIAIEEWNKAQHRVQEAYVTAVDTVLSDEEQALVVEFLNDETLQAALSKLGTTEAAALPDLFRILTETDATIDARVAAEVPE
ncbi:MAG: hypothetical protein AAGF36_00380 [Pseudomonadota bacterium]